MKKEIKTFLCSFAIICMVVTCKRQSSGNSIIQPKDTSLVNLAHLDYLYIPVTFPDGTNAAGVYVYANAPDYNLTPASGEGYTCVDDVSRAVLVYLRSSNFSTDTSVQSKTINLINFLLEMQSFNGYFYNFLSVGNQINMVGPTSINNPEWWSWRALQALTEGSPLIRKLNSQLADGMDQAVNKLISAMKTDLVNLPQTTKVVSGITIPQWLPDESATDQSAILIISLINYCTNNNDTILSAYIKKLADGIMLMQQGDSLNAPYDAFLSWENTWHAYGNEQAYALLKAGSFLNDSNYTSHALAEVDNFYPWLLQNGFLSSFTVTNNGTGLQLSSVNSYAQIAYGIKPMVFAAAEAYEITGQEKYSDLAGHLAAWFLGANVASTNMYSLTTGLCYDGISSPGSVNLNSGAESTIEALLSMEKVEEYPEIKIALNKYKK